MSNKHKTSKSRSNNKRTRKSLRGEWGKVGAPPKKTSWPARPFTMRQLFDRNSAGANGQCELSLRNKVETMLIAGALLALAPVKQPHGGVGRPKTRFVLKEHFDASTMVLAPKKTKTKTVATVSAVSVVPFAVNPASAPQSAVAAPASPLPVAPAIVEVAPVPVAVSAPAPVSAPVSTEPAIG